MVCRGAPRFGFSEECSPGVGQVAFEMPVSQDQHVHRGEGDSEEESVGGEPEDPEVAAAFVRDVAFQVAECRFDSDAAVVRGEPFSHRRVGTAFGFVVGPRW